MNSKCAQYFTSSKERKTLWFFINIFYLIIVFLLVIFAMQILFLKVKVHILLSKYMEAFETILDIQ